jgi:hypothetical protein
MNTCAKGSEHQTEIGIAIKGFTNALDLNDPQSAVYVVYSTLDLSTVEADNVMKMINIQMCMTVTTSASIPNFPVITHMGIFRSPLLSQDLGKLDGALGEIRSVLSKQPDFYKDKLAKSISLVLHSFAARAMMTISNGHQAKLMITAPVAHMGGLLSKAGNIFAEKIVHTTPSDADRRLTPRGQVQHRGPVDHVQAVNRPARNTLTEDRGRGKLGISKILSRSIAGVHILENFVR